MERTTRRAVAVGTIGGSAALAAVSTAPGVSWGLGCLLAIGGFVAGVHELLKPEHRPYDYARDGA